MEGGGGGGGQLCFHFCEKCHCFYLVFWSLAYIILIMICVT